MLPGKPATLDTPHYFVLRTRAASEPAGRSGFRLQPLHQLKDMYKWWVFAHPELVNMRISSNAYA
jgi:hypothetical protein